MPAYGVTNEYGVQVAAVIADTPEEAQAKWDARRKKGKQPAVRSEVSKLKEVIRRLVSCLRVVQPGMGSTKYEEIDRTLSECAGVVGEAAWQKILYPPAVDHTKPLRKIKEIIEQAESYGGPGQAETQALLSSLNEVFKGVDLDA